MSKGNYLLRDLADHISRHLPGVGFTDAVLCLQRYFGPDVVRVEAETVSPILSPEPMTVKQLAMLMSKTLIGWTPDKPHSPSLDFLELILIALRDDGVIKVGHQEPQGTITPCNPMDVQVGGQHYKGDKIQHFTLCMEDNIPWGEASAIKYLMRHRKKNGLQDLLKALHYVEMTIEHYHPGKLAEHRRDPSKSP